MAGGRGARAVSTAAVRLVLPWTVVPSDNLRRGIVGASNRQKWREYRDRVDAARVVALSQVRGERPRFRCPVRLTAEVCPPDNRRRDILNLAKGCADALIGVVYADDSLIYDARWIRGPTSTRWNACVVLTVEPLSEEARET